MPPAGGQAGIRPARAAGVERGGSERGAGPVPPVPRRGRGHPAAGVAAAHLPRNQAQCNDDSSLRLSGVTLEYHQVSPPLIYRATKTTRHVTVLLWCCLRCHQDACCLLLPVQKAPPSRKDHMFFPRLGFLVFSVGPQITCCT